MIKYEARPTEYKGVRFRSKSEATFARTLDIAGTDWAYEPQPEEGGHSWDFLIWPGRLSSHCFPTMVEYKPSRPTDTYIDNLTSDVKRQPVESILVWGNPWSGPPSFSVDSPQCCYVCYPIWSSYSKYGRGDFLRLADNGNDGPYSYRHSTIEMLGVTEQMAQQAKSYRFDLKH